MSRIRTIKPEFFKHEDLYEVEARTGLPIRLAYVGLWTACDREGRFKWRPRSLKLDIMPYDDVDFEAILDALVDAGQVVKYEVANKTYGCVPTLTEHQRINNKEQQSTLPAPESDEKIGRITHLNLGDSRIKGKSKFQHASPRPHKDEGERATLSRPHKDEGERKGKEGKGKEGKEIPPQGVSTVLPDIESRSQTRARAREDPATSTADHCASPVGGPLGPALGIKSKVRELPTETDEDVERKRRAKYAEWVKECDAAGIPVPNGYEIYRTGNKS